MAKSDIERYSVEAVSCQLQCLVDPATFLRVRDTGLTSLSGLNARLRRGNFPGAIKPAGAARWKIDLVTYDRYTREQLNQSLETALVDARKALSPDLVALADDDAILRKVAQKLSAA